MPTVTDAELALVRGSFAQVAVEADRAAALFYARLLALDPGMRRAVRSHLHDQGRPLVRISAAAIAGLERPGTIPPTLRMLGIPADDYGMIEEHSAAIGAALIWTLKQVLGPNFTPAVSTAWTHACTLVINSLIEARRGTRVAA